MAPPGYSVMHEHRSTGRGGGVAVIIRDTITATVEPLTTIYLSFECMRIKAITASFTFRFIIIYRPPPSSKNKLTPSLFLEEFSNFLAQQILIKGKLIIMGDINLHLEERDDTDAGRFRDLLASYGLEQLVQSSTHRSNHTLDAVMTRMEENPITDLSVSDPLLSDHKAITFALDTQRPPLPKKTIVYRQLKKINMEKFKEDLRSNVHLNGEYLRDETDAVTCAQVYEDAARSLLDQHAPEKTKHVTIRPKVEWYTAAVDGARREKRKSERKWKATGLTVHKEIFSAAKDNLTKVITTAKKDFFSQHISESSNTSKALFTCVDRLLHRSRSSSLPDVENSKELAEMMADFFEGKVKKIRDELETVQQEVADDHIACEESEVVKLASFPAISAEDLKQIMLEAPTKSCQLDPLPTKIVKECIDQLLPVILKIINTSLSSSTVPSPFKKAIITPLIKKPTLDRNILKNFRPVSNLPFLSKILEKVVSKSLKSHRERNNLNVPSQSAYRQYHSTETALVRVHNDILRALDRGDCVFLVLLDLSAAFDTVDHARLQERLSGDFGVAEGAMEWLMSYMTNRQQAVMIRGVESQERTLACGVPQGSVLGPELFKDYIAPIADLIHSFDINTHGYADDTQLYASFKPGQTEDVVRDRMQQCIAAVRSWMALNWLKLNDDKTEFIILGSPANLAKVATEYLLVGDHQISISKSVRNIGATFDSSATMQPHIIKTSQTAWYHLFSISKIRPYLTTEQTQCIIHAYVTSRLDQNNSLICEVPSSLINSLQKIQNAAAKVILGGRKYDHVTHLLKELHWLPLSQRSIFKILLLIYKTIHGQGPTYLQDLLVPYSPARNLRSSSSVHLLVVPKTRCVRYGDRAFSVFGPRKWNELPVEIRSCKTVSSFKTALKTHLFKKSYD